MIKKYIKTFIVILVIVVIGYFLNKWRTGYDINITTNKNKYVKGEIVKIIIQNNTNLEKIILSPLYTIEKLDGDNWIEIKKILCPCDAMCNLITYLPLKAKSSLYFEWNQKEEWCTNKLETISIQVSKGTYRVKIEIANTNELYPYKNRKTIYSQKFLIK